MTVLGSGDGGQVLADKVGMEHHEGMRELGVEERILANFKARGRGLGMTA